LFIGPTILFIPKVIKTQLATDQGNLNRRRLSGSYSLEVRIRTALIDTPQVELDLSG
jgi:hypothetical protein